MADTSRPPYRNSESAPFVYFDVVPTFGVLAGAVQIEVASRVLVPDPDGGVVAEFMTTGRLRCSPAAAVQLRQSIDQALQMLEQSQENVSAGSTVLN